MPNIHDDLAALKALQDDIYREKILRARRMTVEERLAEVFALSNSRFQNWHAKAMQRLGTTDEAAGWAEVRRWTEHVGRIQERELYATEKPAGK